MDIFRSFMATSLSSSLCTDSQTDRQTGRQADRQAGRQTDRQAGRQAGRQADRQRGKEAGRRSLAFFWVLSLHVAGYRASALLVQFLCRSGVAESLGRESSS